MRQRMPRPHRSTWRREVVVQAHYVYYPGYQVYYSSNTRQYVYQEGRSWVSRPAPPRVSADVLFASPSVTLAFHDFPSLHYASVVQHIRRTGRHRKRAAATRNLRAGNKQGHE